MQSLNYAIKTLSIVYLSLPYGIFVLLSFTVLSDNVEKCVGLGWCMMQVFDHRGNLRNIGRGRGRGDTVRLALYEGSPRMLLSISHPIAGE